MREMNSCVDMYDGMDAGERVCIDDGDDDHATLSAQTRCSTHERYTWR